MNCSNLVLTIKTISNLIFTFLLFWGLGSSFIQSDFHLDNKGELQFLNSETVSQANQNHADTDGLSFLAIESEENDKDNKDSFLVNFASESILRHVKFNSGPYKKNFKFLFAGKPLFILFHAWKSFLI